MKTLEIVEHNGSGVRRNSYSIVSIDTEKCTINLSINKVVTFVDKEKFAQLMRCGYTYLVCWGDIIEHIIKN